METTPASTTTATPGSTTAGTQPGSSALPPQPPVSATATADWVGALNEESRGYVQNKGFKDPSQLLESYRNLEKLRGVPQERLVTLPDNWDDAEQTTKLYSKLGRPETPQGYGFKTEKGQDETFTKWAEKNFFDAGLNSSQAKTLADRWNGFFSEAQKAQNDAKVAETEVQATKLKKEWGMAYGQNEKVAKMSAAKLGVDAATVDKIEEAIGYEATMKLFHKFGAGMGEGTFVNGNAGNGASFGALTPEAAKSQIQELKSDSEFIRKYNDGDIGSRKRMQDLHIMATFQA